MGLAAIQGHDAIVRLFFEGVDFRNEFCWDYIQSPLVLAASHGHRSIVQLLVALGTPVYKYDSKREPYPVPLRLAVKNGGDLDSIKLLTEAHNHNHEQMKYIGPYELATAAASGHMNAAQYFLDKGVDPNMFDQETGSYPIC